jgi:hypothetical protein
VEPPTGSTVDLAASLQTSGPERYLPTGSQFVYFWELESADGEITRTSEESFTFLDGRYQWNELVSENGDVTVFWYADEQAAGVALRATEEAILEVSELLQVEMPYPVRVVVWRNSSDARAAQRPRGGQFEEMVITGGARVAVDLLHIYDGLGNFVDVARHEAAHLVTRVAGDGPFTRIPSWLDEGTAVYAQNSPGSYEPAINFAVQSDNTMRLRTMTAPTNRADMVNTFYGQSWSTVKFMIEEWGEEPFAELFSVVKAGSRTDDALEEVYGFDQDGLYNRWREHVGLPPIEYEPRAQAGSAPAPDATRAPLGIPTGGLRSGGEPAESPAEATAPEPSEPVQDTPAASSGGSSSQTTALIVLAVAVLVALLLGGVGVRMLRSR